MNCDDARARYLADDTAAFLQHATSCESCRSRESDLNSMRSALQSEAVWAERALDLRERVVEAVAASDLTTNRRRWLIPSVIGAAAVVLAVMGIVLSRPSAPDWEIEVSATPDAGDLTGTISGWEESFGTRVRVDLKGLDPAPADHFYELWFSSETTAVSAGTFTTTDSVELSIGVDRADFPRVWITTEPVDGGPQPEGDLVYDVMTTGYRGRP